MEKQVDRLGDSSILTVREISVRDDLKRLLIYWQLFKAGLQTVKASETLKSWAAIARDEKNKDYIDLQVISGKILNFLQPALLTIKSSMQPSTWNAIMQTLTSEQVKEIDLLINELTELNETAIERVTEHVKDAKYKAGIPLNDPAHQKERESIDDLLWSCVEPATKFKNPEDSDGYDEAEVFAALGRLYKKLKPHEYRNTAEHSS